MPEEEELREILNTDEEGQVEIDANLTQNK